MDGPRVLIVFHSRSGNTLRLARAVEAGARSYPGATVDMRRVPELVDEEALLAHQFTGPAFEHMRAFSVAAPDDLIDYDVIIMGSATSFGSMSPEMKAFIGRLGPLWAKGLLQNKVGAAFTSASSPHGGHEMTLIGFLVAMMHFGMIVAAPGYIDTINHDAGTPYGATATTKVRGERRGPTDDDLAAAETMGRRAAMIGMAIRIGGPAAAAALTPQAAGSAG